MTLSLVEAVAKTLVANNFRTILNVPGFGGTQVFDSLMNLNQILPSICLNEEAAMSIATGASIYGSRSVTLVKTHGLTKMANALSSNNSIGTNAANLIIAFDDTVGRSSDNIFNAKKFAESFEIPVVSINDDPENNLIEAIEISESIQLPVIVYIDCEKLGQQVPYANRALEGGKHTFTKDPYRYIACPPLSRFHRDMFKSKLDNSLPKPSAPALIGNLRKNLPAHLATTYDSYSKFFNAFSRITPDFVAGDAGTSTLYAFDERRLVDVCSYMGGSPGIALGAYLAGAKKSWSLTGDFSFFAAGVLGLNEILVRNAPIKLVIFNNQVAGATGGQPLSPVLMKNFLKTHSEFITSIDTSMDDKTIESTLKSINDKEGAAIVVFTTL